MSGMRGAENVAGGVSEDTPAITVDLVRGRPVDPVVLERTEFTFARGREVGDIMHVGVLNGARSAHWRIEAVEGMDGAGWATLHLRRVVPESVPVPGMPGFLHTVWTEVLA